MADIKYTKTKPYDWYKKEGYAYDKNHLLTAWVQGNVYPEPASKTNKLKKQFVTYIIYDTILTGMGFLLYLIIN